MSDLDRLRRAMRVTERPGVTLDVASILHEGRRLRTRRRVAGAGATTLAVGLAAVVVVVVVNAGPDDPGPPPVAGAATSPVTVAPAPSNSPWPTPPSTTPPPTTMAGRESPPKLLGKIITSGVEYGADQRVFFFVRVTVPGEPRVTIGLAAGRRSPDGTLTSDYLINDVEGSDRGPGFHQIGYDQNTSAAPVPTFGYFVGPASRIVGTVDGRKVAARLAPWSVDPQVVIFWFDPADLTPGDRLDGIVAYDHKNRGL
ncbi:hypothetical protein V6V47_27155 [Micromonospora sp. CPCC 205539]|uniref:hypothetical protein n=1 Tax=Micromonospora sp. CPCC 205539 TaxID=3122408 RepID=UPI002FF3D4CD